MASDDIVATLVGSERGMRTLPIVSMAMAKAVVVGSLNASARTNTLPRGAASTPDGPGE